MGEGMKAHERSSRLEDLLPRLPWQGDPTALGSPTPALALQLVQRAQGAKASERVLLRHAANRLRAALVGETVTYVVNRNLNISNHCVKHCSFCAFRRDAGSPGAFWLSRETLQQKARQAQERGATELCVQGGLNPEARLDGSHLAYAEQLLQDLLAAAPGIHLHAFSPQELLYIAECDGLPLDLVLQRLQQAGLASVPGTAAEVLSEPLRRRLCPEKLSARAWVAVMLEVHRLGLPATSTLLAGHIESSADLAAHLLTLLQIQQRAMEQAVVGFSEFVLLPFVGEAAPAALRRQVGRSQPDRQAMLALTAVARLLLGPWIRQHQPSWVKLGLEGACEALTWGANDLGGTLMEEHITTMAGARGGTNQDPESLEAAAQALGRPVRRRTTTYAPCA
jgi:5-amino-6-(D-ribitylamino)uracil---L-tyrosine 4-hydroxyphenyl transferase